MRRPSSSTPPKGPLRVLRVIARLNLGGPAHHVTLLSDRLDRRGYETLLVTGAVPRGEEELDHEAAGRRVRLERVAALGPALRPQDDLRALIALVRTVRRFRPHIVHTHTAKAGVLGRLAALMARGRRPAVVHTFHGHVLEGYYGPATSLLYRAIERTLAHVTDALVTVSEANAADLARLGVAPRARLQVVPLGLDLRPFLAVEPAPDPDVRDALGVGGDGLVLLWAGRLVAIKRVDVALKGVAAARGAGHDVRLLLAGGGELEPELRTLTSELRLGKAVHFLGYRRDLTHVVRAADAAVLSSDNEGTPVALIEAAAAARPLVTTDAGGVRDIAGPGWSHVVARGDARALGLAISALAAQPPAARQAAGRAARDHVARHFGVDRLVDDVDALYRQLGVQEQ